MPAINRRWTASEVRRLIADRPEYGPRYELIDGELLVTPAPTPRHQIALAWLYDQIAPYVRREHLGTTLWSPADIELEPEQLTQPDLFVVPRDLGSPLRAWSSVTCLVLAIEVLSPGTAANDRLKKRPPYQRAGVECWMVDLDARRIERWRPDDERAEVCDNTLIWQVEEASAPLVIDLAPLWDAATSA